MLKAIDFSLKTWELLYKKFEVVLLLTTHF